VGEREGGRECGREGEISLSTTRGHEGSLTEKKYEECATAHV